MSSFGERLKLALELRSKRPIDLATDLNIPKGNVSMFINDKRPMPKLKTLQKIANYLDVSVSYLMGIDNQMFAPNFEVVVNLAQTPEQEMRKALTFEIEQDLSQLDLETLKTIRNIVKQFRK